jgi:hypothetical protein
MKNNAIEPIDDPVVVLGDNFRGVDKEVCDRCARVCKLLDAIDVKNVDEFAKIQIDEIADVVSSVFDQNQDPALITPSMLEVLEGVYVSQFDFSFDERSAMYDAFCKKFGIDGQ